ncbi:MAG: type III-B CRISPR module-associated Cmr3 family protein [Pseudohongiellaceae bacterium]
MSTIEYRFIEPLDVLFLRGNKLFGDPGSFGECLIPPWPSVAAGAIRSRMLVDRNIDLAAFAAGNVTADDELGTPVKPGSFTLAGFYLARKYKDGKTEILLRPPADLVISKTESGETIVSQLTPQVTNLSSSFPLKQLPVLAQGAKRSKPESGYWLTQAAWAAYLQGEVPKAEQLVRSSALWSFDARVGIGMNETTRSVEDGKLFSAQAVVMHKTENRIGVDKEIGRPRIADYDVGFLAVVGGAIPPADGLLRFGGDGRAASISIPAESVTLPGPDYETITSTKRCRLVLTSPGLFPDGWKLPVTNSGNRVALPGGITAKLESAAVPRAETISGWDLAKWEPKAAQRVAPTGSVYWLNELDASPGPIADALRKLVENGLWGESCEDAARKAEGFNRIAIATWKLGESCE